MATPTSLGDTSDGGNGANWYDREELSFFLEDVLAIARKFVPEGEPERQRLRTAAAYFEQYLKHSESAR